MIDKYAVSKCPTVGRPKPVTSKNTDGTLYLAIETNGPSENVTMQIKNSVGGGGRVVVS